MHRYALLALLTMMVVLACGRMAEAPIPTPVPVEASAPLVIQPDAAPVEAGAVDAGRRSSRVKYQGVNLSGAEFGKTVPGVLGRDYAWPTHATADWFIDRGFNFFRVSFRHERLQPTTKGPLDETYKDALLDLVEHITKRGATVAIEPHNSARFGKDCDPLAKVDARCRLITETEMGDLWGRLAQIFKGNPRVWFNLTNEPHDMPTETWVKLANAGIKEPRRLGATNTILVPGNGWSGAMNWNRDWYGTPNTAAMLSVIDPGDNMVFEAHQYMNEDGSGKGIDCVSKTIGAERIAIFVEWLRATKRRGFIGEIGAKDTPTCKAAIENSLLYIDASADVLDGFSWWAAGHRWSPDYPLSIQPLPDGGTRPQMEWLMPFVGER